MAKELPYFKFEPSEWDNGMIQLCSLQAKGLFIEICCLYWSRLGELPYALALQKLCNGDASLLQELEKNQIYEVENDQIVVKFLDEQLSEFKETSVKRSKAANKRWNNASAMQVHSKSNAIREEKSREDKSKEEDKGFDQFWNLYNKKTGKTRCLTKWSKLTPQEQNAIIDHLPKYVNATPNTKYRKNPLTYLNNRTWEDEELPNQDQEDYIQKNKAFAQSALKHGLN